MIKLGEASVEFDTNFSLYMTTKLANPHYTPQVCVDLCVRRIFADSLSYRSQPR